ncbi:acetyl-CoA carboxylase, carboxyltransferase subunit beta [Pelagibacterium limicola]|uniref:acetyl-CoA carboxylase, carboxyltransferase subunit beta n=1 Tax=Pelagibacterium limicola TaxID=2791022 RepID=UPI0018B004C9|nr:acetyl-CoA carboxylase, carboxyltransferase subunit beta [Pelagibacterium limicola]
MNWIDNVVRPKIRSFLNKRDVEDNLWVKCPESGEMVFHRDLETNQWVVPNSGYHMKIKASDRLDNFFDEGRYERIALPQVAQDPLRFRDTKRYTDRLKEARSKTGLDDAMLVAVGRLYGREVVAGVQDGDFMLGSLGMAAGSAIVTGLETAVERRLPFVIFTASGGARMQEGILSLMQMPRTTVAVQRLREAGLPYIVVLTNPTTGGVTASYAMLGDVHIAEPGALICFAGPRVIEQTIREKLPKGFQRSEYLYEHGMVDMVVHRHDLRATIGSLVGILTKAPANDAIPNRFVQAAPALTARDVAISAEGDDDLLATTPVAGHAE